MALGWTTGRLDWEGFFSDETTSDIAESSRGGDYLCADGGWDTVLFRAACGVDDIDKRNLLLIGGPRQDNVRTEKLLGSGAESSVCSKAPALGCGDTWGSLGGLKGYYCNVELP